MVREAKLADEVLAHRAAEGIDDAFEMLIERYRPLIESVAQECRKLYRIDIEDARSEMTHAFWVAVTKFQYKRKSRFGAFVKAKLWFRASNLIESSKRRRTVSVDEVRLSVRFEPSELSAQLQQLVSELPPEMLPYLKGLLDGYNGKEIAERTGKPPREVSKAIQSIRQHAKAQMEASLC